MQILLPIGKHRWEDGDVPGCTKAELGGSGLKRSSAWLALRNEVLYAHVCKSWDPANQGSTGLWLWQRPGRPVLASIQKGGLSPQWEVLLGQVTTPTPSTALSSLSFRLCL